MRLEARSNETGVLLEWRPPAIAEPPLQRYDIARISVAHVSFAVVPASSEMRFPLPIMASVDASVTAYFDANVTADHVYIYFVLAANACGTGPPSQPAAALFPGPCHPIRTYYDQNGILRPSVHPECLPLRREPNVVG